jgi:uncharacterized protein YbbK (DUF523 family)
MKPRVGVSACLLGQAVRYDGGSRPHAWVRDVLSRHAEVLPFCPETGAGMAVPRPPVQLIRLKNREIVMRGVLDHDLDVTDRVLRWIEQQGLLLAGLDAVIFKSRSPSCGLGSTPLYSESGVELAGNQDGLFADWVRRLFPDLLLFDDVLLEKPQEQKTFLSLLAKKPL